MSVPMVRQISWLGCIPQLLAILTGFSAGWTIGGYPNGAAAGIACYLVHSFGSRFVLLRHHRRGIALLKGGEWTYAIQAFHASYDFLSRYAWIDRYRFLVLMSPAAMQYREMALNNIAFCYGQLGSGAQAKAYYERTIAEFPNCQLAIHSLRMIDAK